MIMRKKDSRDRHSMEGEGRFGRRRKPAKQSDDHLWYHTSLPILEEPIEGDLQGMTVAPEVEHGGYEPPSVQVMVDRSQSPGGQPYGLAAVPPVYEPEPATPAGNEPYPTFPVASDTPPFATGAPIPVDSWSAMSQAGGGMEAPRAAEGFPGAEEPVYAPPGMPVPRDAVSPP
ncbi:MAG: hypothetical protein OXI26_11295, partial [bacterium]|nr:hypothetical protein [bacterium]